MPKTPTRKLKVFQTQFGFFDTVLAAPSQAAALRAWGTHRNLFATGDAKLATDEAAIAAALEHPGIPLRRPVGSNASFVVEPTGLPKIPDLPRLVKATAIKGEAENRTRPKAACRSLQARCRRSGARRTRRPAQAGRGRSASPAGGTRRQAEGRTAKLCRRPQEGYRSRGPCPRSLPQSRWDQLIP